MLSKNNKVKKMERAAQRNNHFSIRKLTVGAASVLLGTSLYLGAQTSQVHADTVKNDDQVTAVVDKANEDKVEDNKDNASAKEVVSDQKDVVKDDTAAQENKNQDQPKTDNQKSQDSQDSKKTETKSQDQTKTSVDTNKKETEATAQTNQNQTYHIKVTAWNDATDSLLTSIPSDRNWNYYFKDGVYEVDAKKKTILYNVSAAPTGYKLMNPDEVLQNFTLDKTILYPAGHDVDITLHYAPLSPVQVQYVDEDNNEVLSTTSFTATSSSSESLAHANGVISSATTSRFTVDAIDIPGYELVSEPEYLGYFDQTQAKGNKNPIIVQFKYKKVSKNDNPKKVSSGANVDGQWFGPNWESLPGGFKLPFHFENGVAYYNADLDQKVQNLISGYEKQGYSYVGTVNYHKSNEVYNSGETGTFYNLIPNKPVTVHYVDEAGNKLHDPTVVESNVNNPDQTNNGIDYKNYWHAAGEWTVTPMDIDGYALTKTYGATTGKYTAYNYDVTFVYTKKETATVPPLVESKPEAAIDVIKYINDTTKETMTEVKVAGEVGTKVDYSTQEAIAQYEKDGYKFVSSNFENGKEVYVKGGQTFEVHFTKAAEPVVPTTPTDPNPTPEPHPEPNPDTDVPDIPAPEVPSVDVPMPHPQTPEVPEEPDETPAPHAITPETPVSEDEGEVPAVHASEVKDNDDVPMPHAAQEALPQTGEKTSVMAVIAGAFASVLGIFGLANRKKEDK